MDAAAAATAATLVGGEGGRASSRVRKVSKALARVDDESRRQAVAARLDALEQDQAAADALGEDSDEYIAEEELDGTSLHACWCWQRTDCSLAHSRPPCRLCTAHAQEGRQAHHARCSGREARTEGAGAAFGGSAAGLASSFRPFLPQG